MSDRTFAEKASDRGGRRLLRVAATVLVAAAVTLVAGTPSPASAATTAVNQCNFDETGAAREIVCTVTVVNNLDVATGVTSSTVSTSVCTGAPGSTVCVASGPVASTNIVGSVDQCNNSVNAGGSTVRCTVNIVNNITGSGETSPGTVYECIGSAASGSPACTPNSAGFDADVNQCNGSGNGGGIISFDCAIATSTVSALWPVTIDQCNGSANGGGDIVNCFAQITTNILAPVDTSATTAPTTGGTGTTPGQGSVTIPPGPQNTLPRTGVSGRQGNELLLALGVAVVGGIALVTARRGARKPLA